MKIINLGLIHPFMFAIFPILFIYTNNLTEISLDSLAFPAILIFGVTVIAIFSLSKISKNIQKSTLTVSFLLFLFFSIGYTRIWLIDIETFGIDIDYFVIFLYFITFVVGLFLIYKIKDWSKPTQIISAISIVVIISFLPSIASDDSFYNNDLHMNIEFESSEKPNIYFIVLDGYAGEKSLKKDFGFDNHEFLNLLKELGFVIPENNFSNYAATVLSTNSFLNMNYLHNQENFSPYDQMQIKYLFSNNLVMGTLQENDYTTIYIDGGGSMRDIRVSDKILCHHTDSGLLQTLIDTSFMTYIYQGFFWHSWNEIRDCAFSELEKLHETSNAPFFVYAHIRTPHDPYLRDMDGNFVEYDERADQLDEATSNQRYIYQLQYTNEKIIDIITKIMSVEQKPIIIIASDHGWEQFASSPPTEDEIIQWHSNFEAFYLPDIENFESYNTITPVNVFRNIFNDYFGTNLEILEDRAYYVDYIHNKTQSVDEVDVTNIIISEFEN